MALLCRVMAMDMHMGSAQQSIAQAEHAVQAASTLSCACPCATQKVLRSAPYATLCSLTRIQLGPECTAVAYCPAHGCCSAFRFCKGPSAFACAGDEPAFSMPRAWRIMRRGQRSFRKSIPHGQGDSAKGLLHLASAKAGAVDTVKPASGSSRHMAPICAYAHAHANS